MESWTGGRFAGPKPKRQKPTDRIHVYFNYVSCGSYVSYHSAQAKIDELLKLAPANLDAIVSYVKLRAEPWQPSSA